MPESLHWRVSQRPTSNYTNGLNRVSDVSNSPPTTEKGQSKRHQKVIQVAPEAPRASTLHAAGVPKLYDPGYASTISCISSITLLDGPSGILRYRGYPIESLATLTSFDEVAYLILYDGLPSRRQLGTFRRTLACHDFASLPSCVSGVLRAFPSHAHPMTILVSCLSALTADIPKLNPSLAGSSVYKTRAARSDAVMSTLAIMPTLAAAIFHHTTDNPLPANTVCSSSSEPLSYTERFFKLALPNASPTFIEALDTILILHADHEQNCSTSAVRHLSSSGVDVFSCLSAGAAALYGPLHGGACEAVVHMLERIGREENVTDFLERVKEKKELLMGFGHRVYKTYDPRARIVHRLAHNVLQHVGSSDPMIRVATALEKAALTDSYFVSRKLYPNVDFYSGIIYKAMGMKPSFFTVLFALGRCVGWLAHWLEYLDDPDRRIARPHQRYTGVIGPLIVPSLDERVDSSNGSEAWDKGNIMARL